MEKEKKEGRDKRKKMEDLQRQQGHRIVAALGSHGRSQLELQVEVNRARGEQGDVTNGINPSVCSSNSR
jgi:hypothetical protein